MDVYSVKLTYFEGEHPGPTTIDVTDKMDENESSLCDFVKKIIELEKNSVTTNIKRDIYKYSKINSGWMFVRAYLNYELTQFIEESEYLAINTVTIIDQDYKPIKSYNLRDLFQNKEKNKQLSIVVGVGTK